MKNKKLNKRGIAVVIGYVLLVVASIVMGGVTYSVVKTYVPQDTPECPSDTSLLIRQAACTDGNLKLTFENRGLFSIDGFYIRAKENADSKLATVNLNPNSEDGLYTFSNPVEPSKISENVEFEFNEEICNNIACKVNPNGKCIGSPSCEKDTTKKDCEKDGCTYINSGTQFYDINAIEIVPVVKVKNEKGKGSTSVCSPAKITEEIQDCSVYEEECPNGKSLTLFQSITLRDPKSTAYVSPFDATNTPGDEPYLNGKKIILKNQYQNGANLSNRLSLSAGRYKAVIKQGAFSRWANDWINTIGTGGGPGLTWESTANVVWKNENNKLTLFKFGKAYYSIPRLAESAGKGSSVLFNHNGGYAYVFLDDFYSKPTDPRLKDNRMDSQIGPVVVDIYRCT